MIESSKSFHFNSFYILINIIMFSRFAIWNTIIGSSLLAMPWSVERAGLGLALILMLTVSTLAVYTAYRLLNVQLHHGMR